LGQPRPNARSSAYISSLGTTAILVAAALYARVVERSCVPRLAGDENGTGVQSVPLAPPTTPPVALVRRASYARAVVRTRPVAAVTRRLSTAGLVKQAGPRVVPGRVMVPARGAPIHPYRRSEGPETAHPAPRAERESDQRLPTGGPDYARCSEWLPARAGPAPGPPPRRPTN